MSGWRSGRGPSAGTPPARWPRVGRPASTVSREVAANGGRAGYYAGGGPPARAWWRRVQSRPSWGPIRSRAPRSPRTWSSCARRADRPAVARGVPRRPGDAGSHETIYQSLYVKPRGGLRRELAASLRTGRDAAQAPRPREQRGRIAGHGPDQRAARRGRRPRGPRPLGGRPDHGQERRSARSAPWSSGPPGSSCCCTCPTGRDRRRRPRTRCAGVTSAARRAAPVADLGPGQGNGPARHVTVDTGIQVYFCDPHSPGSAAPTRTPTACCASTSPRAPTCRVHTAATSKPSPTAQHPPPQDPRLEDTIREAQPAPRCDHRLNPPRRSLHVDTCRGAVIAMSGRIAAPAVTPRSHRGTPAPDRRRAGVDARSRPGSQPSMGTWGAPRALTDRRAGGAHPDQSHTQTETHRSRAAARRRRGPPDVTFARPAQPTSGSSGPRRRRGPLGPTIAILVGVAVLVVIMAQVWTEVLWFSQVGYLSVLTTQWLTRAVLFVLGFLLMGGAVWAALAVAYRSRPIYAPSTPEQASLDQYREMIEPLRKLVMTAGPGGRWASSPARPRPRSGRTCCCSSTARRSGPDRPAVRARPVVLHVRAAGAAVRGVVPDGRGGGRRDRRRWPPTTCTAACGSAAARGRRTTSAARLQLGVTAAVIILLIGVNDWLDRYSLLNKSGDHGARRRVVHRRQRRDAGQGDPGRGRAARRRPLRGRGVPRHVAAAGDRRGPHGGLRDPGRRHLPGGRAALPGPAQPAGPRRPSTSSATSTRPRRPSAWTTWRSRRTTPRSRPRPGALRQDAETTASIRLLDPSIVSPSFRQLQQNKQYYNFPQLLTVDRYKINGKSRDTVIAVRELNLDGLDNAAAHLGQRPHGVHPRVRRGGRLRQHHGRRRPALVLRGRHPAGRRAGRLRAAGLLRREPARLLDRRRPGRHRAVGAGLPRRRRGRPGQQHVPDRPDRRPARASGTCGTSCCTRSSSAPSRSCSPTG